MRNHVLTKLTVIWHKYTIRPFAPIMDLTLGPIFNAQSNKVREWSITVSLYDAAGKQLPIKDDTIVAEGCVAKYSTTSGYSGMKMTVSADTIVRVGKNLGRKNETNVLSQAIKECRSKYAAKIKAGYGETTAAAKPAVEQLPFPMAVKSWKDHKAKLSYPLYVQPKLDGIRMLAAYKDGNVILKTRRLHDIVGFEKVKRELKILFEASGLTNYVIDGEMYSHGMNLQTISGIVRSVSAEESEKERLEYYVFDCFDVKQKQLGFESRIAILEAFVAAKKSKMIVLNDTQLVASDKEAEAFYKKNVSAAYEGVIYKSKGKPYEFDFNKEKRSSWYLKRKKQEDAEFSIVGFTQGRGKDIGCVVFILQAPNGKTFNCVPNGTYDYRKQLYSQAVSAFEDTFEGKLAKVLYDDLSKDSVPLRGRIVQIGRDLSFD